MNKPLPAAARWAIWSVSLALLCGAAWTRLDRAHPVNTDVLAMLPAEQGSDALAAATARSRDAFVHQVLVLVSGQDVPATRDAALAAQRSLSAAGLRPDASLSVDQVLAVYREHHFALLDAEQANTLAQGGAATLTREVAVGLASPAGLMGSFDQDPGGYFTAFLSGLPRPYADFLPDGPFLTALRGDRRYFLLSLQSQGEGFEQEAATRVTQAVQQARAAVARACPACTLEATGAPLFADAARQEAQSETLWLSAVSTLLIMVLIAFAFRSLAPHVLAGLQLVASVLAACAAVILCFGSIQILTLVFGTTLLGIAVDYALLYFAEYWFGGRKPKNVMAAVRPGLYMGLATGVLAFAFLMLAGFPALMQIAVFSIAGLVEAALVVVLVFPVTLTGASKVAAHPSVDWPRRFVAAACRPSRWRLWLPAAVLLLCVPGWFLLKTSDDVRDLQQLPPALVSTDTAIRGTLGQAAPPGFFMVQGRDLEQALTREEALFAELHKSLPGSAPLGLSRFLPSAARQQRSFAAWSKAFSQPKLLRSSLAHLGLPSRLADRMLERWQDDPRQTLDAATLFVAAPDLKRFVLPDADGVALLSTVTGKGDIDPTLLSQAAGTVPGASFEEPLVHIAATFHRIRVRTTWLVVLGYLLISTLLVWRYGRREAVRMLFPPLLALGVTLGALGWLGEPVNIFVVVALILILGLGRDYTVFLREGGATRRSPALAVSLSALTMLCSFGLLALSAIPALHAFGIATLAGILTSYLSAPLSLPPEEEA
ncbi:MAG TPA: MMPL family transporter [Gammaproteobacteria bacterium]|nr:MMPL family transporter [Gammaproteobacteria bacterium]